MFRERNFVFPQEIHKLGEVMNTWVGDRIMSENRFQHLLHGLLRVESDDFIRGGGVWGELLNRELIFLRFAEQNFSVVAGSHEIPGLRAPPHTKLCLAC